MHWHVPTFRPPHHNAVWANSLPVERRWRLIVLLVTLTGMLLAAVWFWPIGPQYVAVPPSFDCRRATLTTEVAICADPLLEKIDVDHAIYYQDNIDAAVTFRATAIEHELERSERAFLATRNRCGRERWCIERAYLYRDIDIGDMAGEPHRVTEPLMSYLHHYVGGYVKIELKRFAEL